MKKALILLASAALLFAGCAKEQVAGTEGNGDTVEVTVTAELLNEDQAKASWDNDGNGAKVDHWIMEVYDAQNKLYDRQEKTGQSGLTNTFNLILIKGQSYKFAFWADKQGSYKTDKLTEIQTVSTVAGLDERDAFFAKKDYTPDMGQVISAQLYRPFAQINIVTLDLAKIYAQMTAAGTTGEYGKYIPKDLKLTCEAYTKFDVLTGTASGAQSTELTLASCYADFSAHAAKTTIFMDYLFADVEKGLKNLAFTFKSNEVAIDYNFANIPLQRNYRTNISGNLLSNDATVNVEIIPIWEEPEYEEELWSAGMITPVTPVGDVYTINLPSELAWVAQQVNTSANTFAGKTVKLAKDIDLNNGEWTPAGGVSSYPSTAFCGTLDGNDFKILNLNCSDKTKEYASAALIGAGKNCTVKNLTVENVKVSSTHYAAALVGYVAEGIVTISNCAVKNGTITSTPEWLGAKYDNGDKVGGFLGYGANACAISGCIVEGLEIKAYRDLGGIAGAVKCAEIKNNTVKNCTITADQTVNSYGKKDFNAGAIVGRSLEGTADESNTAENVVIKTFGNAAEKALSEAVAGETVTVAATPESIGTINVPANLADGVTLVAAEGAKVDDVIIPDGADIKDFTIKGFNATRAMGVALQSGFVTIMDNAKVENLVVEGCEINGQNSRKNDGAGICVKSSTSVYPKSIIIKNCVINQTTYGFYCANTMEGVSLAFDSCSFNNCTSWDIMVNNKNMKSLSITNCQFTGGTEPGDKDPTNLVKVANGTTPSDFTFTFVNNTVQREYGNVNVAAKASQTTMSGNKKNGVDWTPSITILPE